MLILALFKVDTKCFIEVISFFSLEKMASCSTSEPGKFSNRESEEAPDKKINEPQNGPRKRSLSLSDADDRSSNSKRFQADKTLTMKKENMSNMIKTLFIEKFHGHEIEKYKRICTNLELALAATKIKCAKYNEELKCLRKSMKRILKSQTLPEKRVDVPIKVVRNVATQVGTTAIKDHTNIQHSPSMVTTTLPTPECITLE